MARAFGDGEENDDERQPRKGPPAPDPSQGAASREACYADEGDSTSPRVPPSVREEAVEGQHLYLDFVRTEIIRNEMESELDCFDDASQAVIPHDDVDPARLMDWTRAGRELRQLADAFSRSKERATVRNRAQSVNLKSLDAENFFTLLQELFQGEGITRERILVLFFFCADIAIEALRRGFHHTFHSLIRWSLRYIATKVADYVHSAGGWGVVLRQSLDVARQLSACCAFVAIVVACAVYIKKNLKD